MFSVACAALAPLLALTPAAILTRADAPHDAFAEGVIDLRVVVNEHGKPPVDNRLELFVKGKDQSLAVFREGKQKGRKILTVGDRVWLIVPGATRPVPVSKSQRLMGAAAFGDIARLRFADEYDGAVRPEGEPGMLVVDLSAKRQGAAYPKGVLWVGEQDGRPRKLRLLLASGKEAKEVRFTAYGDDHRLKTMEIRDLLAQGGDNATSLTFESYEPRKLDPKIFDPEGARAVP
jgi:Outer membrane lipoprotein-sorting protein